MRVFFDHEILAFGTYENQVGSWVLCTFSLVTAPRYFFKQISFLSKKYKSSIMIVDSMNDLV